MKMYYFLNTMIINGDHRWFLTSSPHPANDSLTHLCRYINITKDEYEFFEDNRYIFE